MLNTSSLNASVTVHENALDETLYRQLLKSVRAMGSERMKKNGSYSTTFWFERGSVPANLAEEAVDRLFKLVNPGPDCIGAEWWLGRLGNGKKLRFHFDRDLALQKETGEMVCPMLGSVYYLNDYPSAPTVIVGQVPGSDGKSRVPEEPDYEEAVEAVANRYMTFAGNLRHGVIPDTEKLHLDPKRSSGKPERRLTLLVNYWHQRPWEPICIDYDGSIYPSLLDGFAKTKSERQPIPA